MTYLGGKSITIASFWMVSTKSHRTQNLHRIEENVIGPRSYIRFQKTRWTSMNCERAKESHFETRMPEIRVVSIESCLRTLMAHELLREMRVVSNESLRESLRERATWRTARDVCQMSHVSDHSWHIRHGERRVSCQMRHVSEHSWHMSHDSCWATVTARDARPSKRLCTGVPLSHVAWAICDVWHGSHVSEHSWHMSHCDWCSPEQVAVPRSPSESWGVQVSHKWLCRCPSES